MDEFYEQVAPYRDAALGLVQAHEVLRDRWGGLPAPDSRATCELVHESAFAGEWGDEPVFTAFTTANLLLLHAGDHIKSMAHTFDGRLEPAPIWSHVTAARATVESSSRARWLLELDVGVRERVARGATERFYGLTEMIRLAGDAATNYTEQRRKVRDTATALGYHWVGSKDRRGVDAQRPSNSELAQALLNAEDPSFGQTVYRFFSAVTHGSYHGLIDAVQESSVSDLRTLAGIGTSSDRVQLMFAATALVYLVAAATHHRLFDWGDDRWNTAVTAWRSLSTSLTRDPGKR